MRKCLFFLLLLTACSAVDVLNSFVPSSGYRVIRDVAYGENARQTLDIYIPEGKTPTATIVFFYGGRWQEGDKKDYLFVAQGLASLGYAVVVPNYRLYPEVKYPMFLEDSALAVRYAHAHIQKYGGSADNIFVMGHSAGAYNAAMLALDSRYLYDNGKPPAWLKGFIGLAGPYDFLPFTDADVKAIFAPANADLTQTQPITYARHAAPAALLLVGGSDKTIGAHNAVNLAAALKKAGNHTEVKTYPGYDHVDVIAALNTVIQYHAPVREDIKAFIEQNK